MATGSKAGGRRKAPALASLVRRLEGELRKLVERVRRLEEQRVEGALPLLPEADADGYYPAVATLDALVARQIIERRRKTGWSQAELARRAGVRQETVCRLETGRHAPNVATVDKLDRALREGGV
ncbi:MAG TPA: helix-turn-helix transcriptional regulator [Gemmataceae bacterium]|jgi:DNA-binding XRE family transcriptional regulator|nr:helix-turn-helix transcriptional regulator [Gemmataceae bacterium]